MSGYDSMKYRLIKMNSIGTELWKIDFPNLKEVARHLKVSLKHVELLLQRHVFDRGKYHVLNKYILFELAPADQQDKTLVKFD